MLHAVQVPGRYSVLFFLFIRYIHIYLGTYILLSHGSPVFFSVWDLNFIDFLWAILSILYNLLFFFLFVLQCLGISDKDFGYLGWTSANWSNLYFRLCQGHFLFSIWSTIQKRSLDNLKLGYNGNGASFWQKRQNIYYVHIMYIHCYFTSTYKIITFCAAVSTQPSTFNLILKRERTDICT